MQALNIEFEEPGPFSLGLNASPIPAAAALIPAPIAGVVTSVPVTAPPAAPVAAATN